MRGIELDGLNAAVIDAEDSRDLATNCSTTENALQCDGPTELTTKAITKMSLTIFLQGKTVNIVNTEYNVIFILSFDNTPRLMRLI